MADTFLKPDPSTYNPSPEFLRELIVDTGMSHKEAARAIGMSDRAMRYYLKGDRKFPYPVQFALECLTFD